MPYDFITWQVYLFISISIVSWLEEMSGFLIADIYLEINGILFGIKGMTTHLDIKRIYRVP